jgi:hypothetical protein
MKSIDKADGKAEDLSGTASTTRACEKQITAGYFKERY